MHSGQWWLNWNLSAVYLPACWSPGDKSFIKVHVYFFFSACKIWVTIPGAELELTGCCIACWQWGLKYFHSNWGGTRFFFFFVDRHASQSWRMYCTKIITASKNRKSGTKAWTAEKQSQCFTNIKTSQLIIFFCRNLTWDHILAASSSLSVTYTGNFDY